MVAILEVNLLPDLLVVARTHIHLNHKIRFIRFDQHYLFFVLAVALQYIISCLRPPVVSLVER